MGTIIKGILGLVLTVVVAFAAWYYRPWSEYSPAEIRSITNPETAVETHLGMDEIFPSRAIAANASDPLPRRLEPLDIDYRWDGEDRTLDDYLEASNSTALMVLRDGEVVYERYLLGADENSRFTSWSVAKSFVATLIAMAMHDGLIDDLDQTAEEFAPQFAGTDYGATSLRHLLMMSAGVDFNEAYSAERSDINKLFFDTFILARNVDTAVGNVERDREPGEDLHYTSPNTHVLSAVARAVYGGSLAQVAEERIWDRLGMEGPASWSQNVPGESGIAIGYCCLNAHLADYARFGQFYLQDGVWNGERLLPEGWVNEVGRAQAPFQEPGATEVYAPRGYSLHFWLPPEPDGEFFAAGVYGQYVWVDRRRNVVIARMAADPQWYPRTRESIAVMRAIVDEVAGE